MNPSAPEPPIPTPAAADRVTPYGLAWGWIAALVVLIAGFASIALDTVYHFRDTPIDGPFQLYNGLRRLAAGQHYGGTFQVFHGPGVPYLHLIPFLMLGGDFLASEFARQIVSVGAAIAVLLAFFRAWCGNWRDTVVLSVIALIALVLLRVDALVFPINSMIGLRSTMPLVIGIHLLRRPSGWRAALERAALIAVAFACGIEQGMASTAALVAVLGFTSLRRRDWRPLAESFVSAFAGVVLYVALVALMTPSGFGSVLRYNFTQVPTDQFWYFGGPPNPYLSRPLQLLLFLERPLWTTLVLVMIVYTVRRLWRGAILPDAPRRVAELFLMVYAMVSASSMLGTFAMVYFQPAVRVALFIALVALWRWWDTNRERLRVSPMVRRHGPALVAATMTLVCIAMLPLRSIAVVRTPIHMLVTHLSASGRPTMSPDWLITARVGGEEFDRTAAAVGHVPVVWSTYSSLLEANKGVFNPSFDYIIHALGHDARRAYATSFVQTKPDLVQTLDPTYTAYEEWLSVHHWNFYRPLLRDYHLSAIGPWSFFWTRDSVAFDERPRLVGAGAVPAGQLGIALDGSGVPKDSIGLFEVRLFYHTGNPLKKLPVVGGLPRYLVFVDGAANHLPISLAPYETEKAFPVVTYGPTQIRLLGSVQSITPGASLVFDSIRAERIGLSPRNRRWAQSFIRGPIADTTAGK
jgi:hypothetical protein